MHGQFPTDLEIDTPWGTLCFKGVVHHSGGYIDRIESADGDAANAEIGYGDDRAAASSSRIAKALWPLIAEKIRDAHAYELAESLPRHDDRPAYRTLQATL